MKIFVGNLSFESNEEDLRRLFETFGKVDSTVIVREKKGVKSRGFGFVEMFDEGYARAAIAALDGKDFMGRILDVSPARSKFEPMPEPVLKEQRRGGYKNGRRSRSFISKRAGKGLGAPPLRKFKANPMRWQKKKQPAKPWQKKEEASPWQNKEKGFKPWRKKEEGHKPWQKKEGGAKPWRKEEPAKPRRKVSGKSKPAWVKKKMYGKSR